jgi:hypothetical protein
MNPNQVTSESEFHERLRELGFEKTNIRSIKTGTWWKHKDSGKHIIVPMPVESFYPDWMINDVYLQIDRLSLWDGFKKKPH